MNTEHEAGLRSAVFRNTAKDAAWLGYWLKSHQKHENLDEEKLAKKLGLTMENYVLLCLCRTPRQDHLRDDVTAICRRTGVRELDLLRLLRQEQNLDKLRRAGPSRSRGWLMAASDRPSDADSAEAQPLPPPEEDTDD
jgi:hypothetical protein